MLKRIAAVFCLFPLIGIVGCVGQSAYEKKADEATNLSRALAELQRQDSILIRDNEGLRADIAALRLKIEELEITKKRLEETIESSEQSPYKYVAELEREKVQLRNDLAKILRTQDDRVRTSRRFYERCLEGMKEEIASGLVRITELRGTIRIELLDNGFFDDSKTELSMHGETLILKVTAMLKDSMNVNVSVESYFEIPSGSSRSTSTTSNSWDIPVMQSLSVARYLQKGGVGAATISAVTRGDFDLGSPAELNTGTGRTGGIDILLVVKE
jgi:flagellar motor protein MotB